MAMVSPEVDGPMIAKTFSSSISCLAKETAFSGLPPESLITSSIFLPMIAALGVDILNQHLERLRFRSAEERRGARDGKDRADLDRVSGEDGGNEQCGNAENEYEQSCHPHEMPP